MSIFGILLIVFVLCTCTSFNGLITSDGKEKSIFFSMSINRYYFVSVRKGCISSWCFGSLRERLRTHKTYTKDQSFYLNYHKFSIKSYVLEVRPF